jgi:ABC-type multidrug transport system ATPase subunit
VTLLAIEDLELAYQQVTVLSQLRLAVERGRWVALLGANASGKTTLLRCIAGRHEPVRGTVRVDGEFLYPARPGAKDLPGFAIPPEELPPFLTVRQCIDIYTSAHTLDAPPPECAALIALLGLDAHAHALVRHCSLGTRQKLAIVLALMTRPTLLLLDEVFNGLDFGSALKLRLWLRERVDQEGRSILLATHSLDVVMQCCHELVLLEGGRLVRHWSMDEFAGGGGLAALEEALADAGGTASKGTA